MKLGLFGHPLGHSYSKALFNKKFETENNQSSYELFDVKDSDQILDIAFENHLDGFNITIPHKTEIMPKLSGLNEAAKSIGAVNTVKKEPLGWIGYNTDWMGFKNSLGGLNIPQKKVLVLGSGGSSKAIQYALSIIGLEFVICSRSEDGKAISYSYLKEIGLRDFGLIVNCTPVGMHPNNEGLPELPYESLTSNHVLYDLVYNPEMTEFLKKGEEVGVTIKNGLEMLILQAEAAWEIWAK